MFKKRSPNSASNIQPQYTEEMQTFLVDLYDPQIRNWINRWTWKVSWKPWVQLGKGCLQLKKERPANLCKI